MNKDFYMLANEIADPMDGTDNAASFFQEQPDDAVTEQYRNHMLAAAMAAAITAISSLSSCTGSASGTGTAGACETGA